MAEQIIGGVISGLLTSIIVLIFVTYWGKAIKPWFERHLYSGIRIDGTWCIQTDIYHGPAEAIITQSAHHVTGTITWQHDDSIDKYTFQGEFRDLILTVTYEQEDAHTLDRGTVTLLCLENGQKLKGCYSWYDHDESTIVSGGYELTRKKINK